MANLEDKQQYELKLDLEDVPENRKEDAKEEVGQFLVDSIMENLDQGNSPVSGQSFKKLSKKYAEKMKGGDRTPNLELDGDLRAAIGHESSEDGIIIGVMDKSQRPKADGHNNFSGKSNLPLRRFIPSEEEKFKKNILNGVDQIIETYKEQQEGISTDIRDILSNQSIADLLLRRLRNG